MAVPAYLKERSGALERGTIQLRNLHDYAVKRRDQLANNDVDSGVIHDIVQRLTQAKTQLGEAEQIIGFWDYAQSEYEDQTGKTTLDVQAEFDATVTELDEAVQAAMDTIPQDADGYLLDRQWNSDGTLNKRMFTPTETATLQTKLDDLEKSIDVTA